MSKQKIEIGSIKIKGEITPIVVDINKELLKLNKQTKLIFKNKETTTEQRQEILSLILNYLEQSNCSDLDLSGLKIGDQEAQLISEKAKENKALTNLSLYECGIGPQGAKLIACITHLKWLDLRNNNIGPQGAEAFSTHPNLKFLALDNNKLGPVGAIKLSPNKVIEHLTLNYNGIEWDGILAIITGMTSLKSLSANYNNPYTNCREFLLKKYDLELMLEGEELQPNKVYITFNQDIPNAFEFTVKSNGIQRSSFVTLKEIEGFSPQQPLTLDQLKTVKQNILEIIHNKGCLKYPALDSIVKNILSTANPGLKKIELDGGPRRLSRSKFRFNNENITQKERYTEKDLSFCDFKYYFSDGSDEDLSNDGESISPC